MSLQLNGLLKTMYLSVRESSKAIYQVENSPKLDVEDKKSKKKKAKKQKKKQNTKLTHNSTLVCHQRGQSFNLIHRHIHAVSDT